MGVDGRVTSRREFIEVVASAAALAVMPGRPTERMTAHHAPAPAGFVDLIRPPDRVFVETAVGDTTLAHDPDDSWTADGIRVTTSPAAGLLRVSLASPGLGIKRVRLRWRGNLAGIQRILGDAWERAYGDLEWRGWVPDRAMPWYFATHDGSLTHAYGVRAGPRAFCFWQVDTQGISLWADVRSGALPVQLGSRTLEVCDVVCRAGHEGETSFAALHAFCRLMCANPRLPSQPVYGSNDWYWAYGKNSADTVRADAEHIVSLSPNGMNRPFVVIDDGWQPGRGSSETGSGAWDRGNDRFPDMAGLAADIRRAGGRPGIWIRPLLAPADSPERWRRRPPPVDVLDPTVPEVREKVAADIARLREWGFELIKHDYTTYDVLGRWGFQMGATPNVTWTRFAAGQGQTTAEIIDDLYRTIREAAGDTLLIGCNTVSHLSAGRFEICRVGDDTSGTEWGRTRKMGVNSLAFRGVQHGAFYVADADCVGVTTRVPWALTRQWLDLLSRSGTALFVSLAPDALGAEQRRDLREALAIAAAPQPLGEPLDWQQTVYPTRWRLMGRERTYDWVGADGAGPP